MRYKIGIIGSYGGMNLGDEAILESILKQIRASVEAELIVFSRNPEDTQRRHKVRAIPFRDMHKDAILAELKDLDLLILGGGGILFDSYAEIFLREVNWARELGIPIFVYAISVGPLTTSENKALVAMTLNRVDRITVREREAKIYLTDLGVRQEITVTADPALLMEEQEFPLDRLEHRDNVNSPIVGFSVREPGKAAPDLEIEQYHAILANAADFLVDRFKAQILFIPMEQGEDKDLQHSHAVAAKMAHAESATVLKGDYNSGQILGLVKHLSFVVGMRLHLLIFSAIQNVPFVPLPYASKVSGFLADLDMPVPKITKLNAGKLCAFLDKSWDGRNDIKRNLEEKVPELQQKARQTNTLLCDFLSTLKPRNARVDLLVQ